MKFLLVLLLSATVFQVTLSEKTKRCPEGFDMFRRKPTDRNNHTSQYCLGIVKYNESMYHDVALTLCSKHNATLSTVESEAELNIITAQLMLAEKNYRKAGGRDIPLVLTVDGTFNPQCKDYSKANKRKTGGFCELDKSLFVLQDFNTDPTFIMTRMKNPNKIPAKFYSYDEGFDGTDFRKVNTMLTECLVLTTKIENKNSLENVYCTKVPDAESYGALCGTFPV